MEYEFYYLPLVDIIDVKINFCRTPKSLCTFTLYIYYITILAKPIDFYVPSIQTIFYKNFIMCVKTFIGVL